MDKYRDFRQYLRREYQGPFVATDIIIKYDNGEKAGIVLIDRKYPPFGVALPGGIAEYMTFEENAIKEAKEETGLDIELNNPEKPLCVLSKPGQDPRAFIASITYIADGRGELKPQKNEDAKSAAIYSIEEILELLKKPVWAFSHHPKILSYYLKQEDKI